MSRSDSARDAHSGGGQGGLTAPLRIPLFRALWSANLASNFGWLIQGVGAAWLMTALTDSADMVALVQTATQLPILVFALLAGAAADLWERRRVLLMAQAWMFAVSALLVVLALADMLTPWLLLAFTFALGAGMAVNGPATQAVVREIVKPELLGASVTINAVAFNLARAVGPALGGSIVAAAGASAAFLVNALSYLPLMGVLIVWRRQAAPSELPRERVISAMQAGLRYVAQTPVIGHAMVRGGAFGFAATSVLALLPLVAKHELEGGPLAFGVLLGMFGIGALIGAFIVHPARQRFGAEPPLMAMTALYGTGLLLLGLAPSWPTAMIGLVLMGGGWLGSLSAFNIAVQLASAHWVQARVLSIYQMMLFGMMALGSWIWGVVAEAWGIGTSLALAGLAMLANMLLAPRLVMPSGRPPDMRRVGTGDDVRPEIPIEPDEGPVLVQIEYRVPTAKAGAFVQAMDEVHHVRRRNGALRWRLFQDVTDAEHWTETFLIADWLDYRRLHWRTTAADKTIEAAAHAWLRADSAPVIRRMIARRHDSRFALDPEERGGTLDPEERGGTLDPEVRGDKPQGNPP